MNKILLLFLKVISGLLLLPVLYVLISVVLTLIPVNTKPSQEVKNKFIYLNTNGVHLDIVIPKKELKGDFVKGVKMKVGDKFISFGWGDRNFYINTPTWNDLTFKVAVRAMFLKSATLMHVTKYQEIENDWIKIPVSSKQLQDLITYCNTSFNTTDNHVIRVGTHHYGANDEFYEAEGSYSMFKTCNTWANSAVKATGLKTGYWTPLDKGVLWYYK